MADKEKKGGIGKWFREFKSEWKKIVWPGRKQLKNNTLVVIACVVVVTLVIFAFDSGFKALVGLVVPEYEMSTVITDEEITGDVTVEDETTEDETVEDDTAEGETEETTEQQSTENTADAQ